MKATASDIFGAGARIAGIVAIIKSIEGLILIVPAVFGLFGQNHPGWAITEKITTLIYPLALLIIGIYLLLGTTKLVNKFYSGEEKKTTDSAPDVFQLAMKITGMVLIVYAVPEFLHFLSAALYMGYYDRFCVDTSHQQIILIEQTLATFVSFLFGVYLLNGGRFFLRMAFKDNDDEDK